VTWLDLANSRDGALGLLEVLSLDLGDNTPAKKLKKIKKNEKKKNFKK